MRAALFLAPPPWASVTEQLELAALAEKGLVPRDLAQGENPLSFVVREGVASSLTDAAYRYVRHTPGANVVLFGTSDPAHLRDNVASINKPALPAEVLARIDAAFGALVGVGLDAPAHNPGAAA